MTKIQQVIPIFRSFDETKAKEFYVDYLGFRVTFEHRFDDDESPLYLGLAMGDEEDGDTTGIIELHMSEHHGDATPGSTIRLEVDDIETFHAELTAKKYRNARPSIQHQPWGYREVTITDPFGNKLIFCQPDKKKEGSATA